MKNWNDIKGWTKIVSGVYRKEINKTSLKVEKNDGGWDAEVMDVNIPFEELNTGYSILKQFRTRKEAIGFCEGKRLACEEYSYR
jgi:hypothetical protein